MSIWGFQNLYKIALENRKEKTHKEIQSLQKLLMRSHAKYFCAMIYFQMDLKSLDCNLCA